MVCSVTSPCRSRRRRGPSACSRKRSQDGAHCDGLSGHEYAALSQCLQKQARRVCGLLCAVPSLCRSRSACPAFSHSTAEFAWPGAERSQVLGVSCCMMGLERKASTKWPCTRVCAWHLLERHAVALLVHETCKANPASAKAPLPSSASSGAPRKLHKGTSMTSGLPVRQHSPDIAHRPFLSKMQRPAGG